MENIERMKPSQTYEVMDLWLRTTIHSNSFVEENFWETHYDFVKEKYINGKENFVYIIDGKIVAFTGEDVADFSVTLLLDWNQRIRNRILLPDFIGSRKFSDIIETHDFSPSQAVPMKHHSLSGCIFMQNGSGFHYSIGKTQAQANFMISYQFPCSFPRADFMLA